MSCWHVYRTPVRSLAMLVSDWLTQWLTHWLTDSCLVKLIDPTLACEDANTKLVTVVSVVDVIDEDRDGNSLLQIWKLRFGHKVTLARWTQPSGPLFLWQCLWNRMSPLKLFSKWIARLLKYLWHGSSVGRLPAFFAGYIIRPFWHEDYSQRHFVRLPIILL